MSHIMHYSINGWEAACKPIMMANMTSNPGNVTCNYCSRVAERVARAKHRPSPAILKNESGRWSRSGRRVIEQMEPINA